jgi:hypothetical protein
MKQFRELELFPGLIGEDSRGFAALTKKLGNANPDDLPA